MLLEGGTWVVLDKVKRQHSAKHLAWGLESGVCGKGLYFFKLLSAIDTVVTWGLLDGTELSQWAFALLFPKLCFL